MERKTTKNCFDCGKSGHRIADCPTAASKPTVPNNGTGPSQRENPSKPKEAKPNARVFAMTQEEADDTTDVVSGTILLATRPESPTNKSPTNKKA